MEIVFPCSLENAYQRSIKEYKKTLTNYQTAKDWKTAFRMDLEQWKKVNHLLHGHVEIIDPKENEIEK